MAKRGPPPTPTRILECRGSWRAKARSAEPKPELGAPTCPSWLPAPAKAAWRQLVPQLMRMGVLTKIDRNALARYCTLWARWKEAEIFIAKNGSVFPVKARDGRLKVMQKFPQVGTAERLATQLLQLEQEFGLTPSSRARTDVPADAPPDDLERFFAKRRR